MKGVLWKWKLFLNGLVRNLRPSRLEQTLITELARMNVQNSSEPQTNFTNFYPQNLPEILNACGLGFGLSVRACFRCWDFLAQQIKNFKSNSNLGLHIHLRDCRSDPNGNFQQFLIGDFQLLHLLSSLGARELLADDSSTTLILTTPGTAEVLK